MPDRPERALSQAEKEDVFRIATRSFAKHHAEQIKDGMTDEEFAQALTRCLGIWGGSCGPGKLDVVFQGAGLKIWGGWHFVNHATDTPLFAGKATLAMARQIYGILDPDHPQLSLF